MKSINFNWTGPGLQGVIQTDEKEFMEKGNHGIHVNLIHEKKTGDIVGLVLLNDGNFKFQIGQKLEIKFL